MRTTATHNQHDTTPTAVVFMACELSEKTWKLGVTTGPGQQPRERMVAARHQACFLQEIAQAKSRFALPDTAPVVRGYAAGREGFWRHRFLQAPELAWSGVRSQPERARSGWCRERLGGGGKRLRRMGIVAVTRKLLMALWRGLESGGIPEGAHRKAACAVLRCGLPPALWGWWRRPGARPGRAPQPSERWGRHPQTVVPSDSTACRVWKHKSSR
jgi:hypothetical protein